VEAEAVAKVSEPGGGPDAVERVERGDIEMIFNTPFGRRARSDGYEIRTAAVAGGVPSVTTMAGMAAAVQAIEAMTAGEVGVRSLQEYLSDIRRPGEH
jgi:carbamoyl-phosphate synthase large subunit